MPRTVASLMALIAGVALPLGLFVATGRWFRSLSEPEQGSVIFLRTMTLGYVGLLGLIIAPILLADVYKDWRARCREALASRMAEEDRKSMLGPPRIRGVHEAPHP